MRKIRVDDTVTWLHTCPDWWREETFEATGTVIKLFMSTVGGKEKALVAKIEVPYDEYWKKIDRRTTVISVNKLKLVPDGD